MDRHAVLLRLRIVTLAFVALLAGGCGIRFAKASLNKPLPSGFSERTLYPDGAAAYDLEDLVGNILLEKSIVEPVVDSATGQTTQITRKKYTKAGVILPDNFSPTVRPIKEALMYYRSKIDQGASTQGSYLAFSASMSGKQLAELTISDSAIVSIPNTRFPEAKILEYVKSHPTIPQGYTARLWVRSVILSRKIIAQYTEINANASGVIGDTIGAKGGVYTKDTEEVGDVLLGMDTHDIDKMAKRIEEETRRPSLLFLSPEGHEVTVQRWLKESRVTTYIQGNIE